LYYMYDDLVKAIKEIGPKVFLGRPKECPSELDTFIVVDIPTRMRNLWAGNFDRMPFCYGTYTVFCKAKKDCTLNVGVQTDLVQKVLDKFPLSGEHIAATRPNVLMDGEDGYGYQATVITFTIRGK